MEVRVANFLAAKPAAKWPMNMSKRRKLLRQSPARTTRQMEHPASAVLLHSYVIRPFGRQNVASIYFESFPGALLSAVLSRFRFRGCC